MGVVCNGSRHPVRHYLRSRRGRIVEASFVAFAPAYTTRGAECGQQGWLSAGVGWSYGRSRQWETHLLVGFVPKYKSGSAKPTFTIKENFMPWRIMLNQRMMLEPLSCGLYVNTIGGGQFWSHLPSRYPNNYYLYSTRFRINVFIGERVTWTFGKGRRGPRSITAFYELSTCDLYLLDFFGNRSVKAKDIVGLSLGVKLQVF